MKDKYKDITVKPAPQELLDACQSTNAISQVFGSLILQPAMAKEYPLDLEDFVMPLHKIIYGAILNLIHSGINKLDISIIESYLSENYPTRYKSYNRNNGSRFLQLAVEIADIENFKYYYDSIKKYSLLREFAKAGQDISEFFREDEIDPDVQELMQEHLDALTLEQLGEYYKNKISSITNRFNFNNTRSAVKAGGDRARIQKELWKNNANYGISYASNYLTYITDGIKQKRLTVISCGTGVGKTRMTLANIAHSFAPEYWDAEDNCWKKNPNGTQNRCLYIGTEMELTEEIEPILEAYIAYVPQEHILHPDKYEPGEEARVDRAIEILDSGFIFLEYLPEYCCATLEETIARHVFQNGVTHVFFDYIHTTAQLSAEYKRLTTQDGRDDLVLANLSNKLKDWARKYNISLDTWTQVNGEFGNDSIRDQRLVRGSKAIIDKSDIAGILSVPTDGEIKKIDSYLRTTVRKGRLMCLSLYKNRGGKHTNVKIWLDVEYDTMRVHDLFVTDYNYGLINDVEKVIVVLNEDTNTYDYYNNYASMMKSLHPESMQDEEPEAEHTFDEFLEDTSWETEEIITDEYYNDDD